MSSEKRSKEDTWRPEELHESLKNVFADSSAHKSEHKGSRHSKEKRQKEGNEDMMKVGDERSSHSKKPHSRNRDDSDAARRAMREKSKVEDAENRDMDGKKKSKRDESGRKERKKHNTEEGEERFESKSDRREKQREGGKEARHRENSEEKQERRRSKHRESDKKERSLRENEKHVEEDRRDKISERREARKEVQKDSRRRDDSEEKRESRRRSKHRESEKEERSRQESQDNKVEKTEPKHDRKERRDNEQPRASNGENEREHRRSRHKESKRREERHEPEEAESLQKLPLDGVSQQSANTTVPSQSDDYENDFEDYEDDFEDDVSSHNLADEQDVNTSEVEALRMAMLKENEATYRQTKGSANTSRSSSATSKTTARSRQTFINFTAAKQRQINNKTSMRMKQRGKELMNLIELDISSCSLFEMPPVKEYELYIKSYGRSDTKQAFVQCHEDVLDRDIQTEPIETRDVMVQHPFEGASVINLSNGDIDVMKSNPVRLSAFLEKASQVMNALLDETMSHSNTQGQLQTNKHSVLFSEGYSMLNSDLPFLEGRYVTCAQFHPHQVNLLLTVYSSSKLNGSNSSVGDILCVWNINNLSQPQRILRSKSRVRSCCFSPIKSTLAFAGTVDGAILVWDLREPVSMHRQIGEGDVKWPLRAPTFSTYGAYNDETHHSTIVRVQPVVSAEDRTSNNKNDETNGLSFQLASLDEQGVIHFWVVIDLDVSDSAGSETDFGLVPGGKVKLLRSSTIILESPSRNLSQTIRAKDMKFSTTDPNQFYVATDSTSKMQLTTEQRVFVVTEWLSTWLEWHGQENADQRHLLLAGGFQSSTTLLPQTHAAQLVAFCMEPGTGTGSHPSVIGDKMAASSDGSIYLYSLNFRSPLITWSNSTGGLPIVCIAWSRSRPSVFYVVDVTSKMYAWELLTSTGGPVKTEQLTNGRITTMELSCDHTATGKTHQGKAPTMVISDDRGGLDVYVLNQHFAVADGNEMEQMVAFLDSLK